MVSNIASEARPQAGFATSHIAVSPLERGDKDVVMAFCEAAHAESIFAHIPFSPKKFEGIFDNIISEGTQHFGMKAVHGDRVVGVIYFTVGGYFIGDGARVVSVIMIKVASQVQNTMLGGKVALQMVRSVNAWAKANDIDVVLFHVTSGRNLPKTDRFFRRMGMKTVGGNYAIFSYEIDDHSQKHLARKARSQFTLSRTYILWFTF